MKLSEKDRKELNELYLRAQNTPVIQIGSIDLSTCMWDNYRAKMFKLGKKYGFNPKTIRGIDSKTGEVVL